MKRRYSIVDIEATGGNHKSGKIIEIGVVDVVNGASAKKFSQLVNPKQSIDSFVSKLTGISDKDVAGKPVFESIAEKLYQQIKDSVFVAHNVSFDYAFLKTEFKKAGIEYSAKHLCTIELSKELIPDEPSYSLGKLCKSLGIDAEDRHRALGDAEATALLFEYLLSLDGAEEAIVSLIRNEKTAIAGFSKKLSIPQQEIDDLPDKAGVFFIQDENGTPLYIDRGASLRQKAVKVLSAKKNYSRLLKDFSKMRSIDYALCGNELITELYFYESVFSLRPRLNSQLRQLEFRYCIHIYGKGNNRKVAISRRSEKPTQVLQYFKDYKTAEKSLIDALKKHKLSNNDAYFDLARADKKRNSRVAEHPTNQRKLAKLIRSYKKPKPSGFILGEGRFENEKGLVKVVQGEPDYYAFKTPLNGKTIMNELKHISEEDKNAIGIKDGEHIIRYFVESKGLKVLKEPNEL